MTGDSESRIRALNEAKILEAAMHLFSTKGFDGTTISEIAEVSGLPKANVYYYFPTKAVIYERLISEVLKDWDIAMDLIRPERDPKEALTEYIHLKLESARRHGAKSRFFAGELLRGGSSLSRKQKQHMQDVTKRACATLEHWITEGLFAPVDPRHFFLMLWAMTQFYSDFTPVVTATLDVPRLRKSDFDEAAAQILQFIRL